MTTPIGKSDIQSFGIRLPADNDGYRHGGDNGRESKYSARISRYFLSKYGGAFKRMGFAWQRERWRRLKKKNHPLTIHCFLCIKIISSPAVDDGNPLTRRGVTVIIKTLKNKSGKIAEHTGARNGLRLDRSESMGTPRTIGTRKKTEFCYRSIRTVRGLCTVI